VTQPTYGSVAITGATATYTPNGNYNGSDSFTYKANDGAADSNTATASVTVNAVNDAPSFTAGGDQATVMTAGEQIANGWATDISAGPANESSQTVSFQVTAADASLFSAGPAVSSDGILTFTPAGTPGTTTVDVVIMDDGGTANSGVDASAAQTFSIVIADNTALDDDALPTEFRLEGAYPNPFNPTTTIQFDLPTAADVRVQVVDLTGRIVMNVPVRTMSAGANQQIILNAPSLSSGSYFYRVIANMTGNTEVATGSFVLLK